MQEHGSKEGKEGKEGDSASEFQPGSLLFVAGPDGDDNAPSQHVAKYLFLGDSGRDVVDPGNTVIPSEHSELDTVVLLVRRDGVALFHDDGAQQQEDGDGDLKKTTKRKKVKTSLVSHASSLWPELDSRRLLAVDAADADAAELFKLECFLRMTAGVQATERVGCAVPSRDAFEVEKWPLVQAFGLEEYKEKLGFGVKSSGPLAHGFFTMSHSLCDTTRALYAVLRHYDCRGVRCVPALSFSLSLSLSLSLSHLSICLSACLVFSLSLVAQVGPGGAAPAPAAPLEFSLQRSGRERRKGEEG